MNKCKCGCNTLVEGIWKRGHCNKGKKLSNKHRKKMSLAHKGIALSDEHKRKVGLAGKGRVVSLETRLKISKGNRGKKHSKKSRLKMSLAQQGDKGSNWQGGISFEPYGFDFDKYLKVGIRKRDKNKCQLCGIRKYKRDHHVHHIDYDKENSNLDNLITLCISCHMKTNFNRDKWIKLFFNMKIKNIRVVK